MLNCGNLKVNSIDYIVIIDKNYNVLYNTRYESSVNNDARNIAKEEYEIKSLFEVYPLIDFETSSFVECITTGNTVVRMHQTSIDYNGEPLCTDNITMPIIRKGKIMGAIEIAKDVTTVDSFNSFLEDSQTALSNIDMESYISKEDDEILTNNTEMLINIDKAKLFARTPNPVLIYGETGTGKELYASLIMNESGFPKSKIITQNCAAVPKNIIDSILFGTKKGAYTDAENRKGLFEMADGGILFLDELTSIPYDVQSKLLRVIQEGTFRPIGSSSEKKVNVKIIAAMNLDPEEAMNSKSLRKDLFYRFASSLIYLLPLRDRPEDIEYYIDVFVRKYANTYKKKVCGVDDSLLDMLRKYRWEGNVRELKYLIESMVHVSKSNYLDIKDMPNYLNQRIKGDTANEEIIKAVPGYRPIDDKSKSFNLRDTLTEVEKKLIINAVRKCEGNKTKASELLGIPRQTMNYKISKLNITAKIEQLTKNSRP